MTVRRPRLAPWRAACLVALLLLAQALGLGHAVAHAAWPQGGEAAAVAGDTHDDHTAGSAECRLVDAHAHGDLASAGAWLMPALACAPLLLAAPGWQPPALAPGWRSPARGPPRRQLR